MINVNVCGQVLDQFQHLECHHSTFDSELRGVSYFPTPPYLIFRQDLKNKKNKVNHFFLRYKNKNGLIWRKQILVFFSNFFATSFGYYHFGPNCVKSLHLKNRYIYKNKWGFKKITLNFPNAVLKSIFVLPKKTKVGVNFGKNWIYLF